MFLIKEYIKIYKDRTPNIYDQRRTEGRRHVERGFFLTMSPPSVLFLSFETHTPRMNQEIVFFLVQVCLIVLINGFVALVAILIAALQWQHNRKMHAIVTSAIGDIQLKLEDSNTFSALGEGIAEATLKSLKKDLSEIKSKIPERNSIIQGVKGVMGSTAKQLKAAGKGKKKKSRLGALLEVAASENKKKTALENFDVIFPDKEDEDEETGDPKEEKFEISPEKAERIRNIQELAEAEMTKVIKE